MAAELNEDSTNSFSHKATVRQQMTEYMHANYTPRALVTEYTPDWRSYLGAFTKMDYYPLFAGGIREADAFVSLFTNNLSTLLVIVFGLLGIWDVDLVYHNFLPGVGIAMVWGNTLYWWQARALAYREKRGDVCTQPYGINTPGAFAFLFSVAYPTYFATGDARLSWLACVASNLIQGCIILAFCFIGETVRVLTPPVALLASISSVGFGFLAFYELLDVTAVPIIALLPFIITMVGYFGRVRFGFMPPVILALIVGTALSWMESAESGAILAQNGGISLTTASGVQASASSVRPYAPVFPIAEVARNFDQISPFVSIIIPNAIAVAIGTIQCVESAKRAGDTYSVRISLFIDGFGTVLAAFFGSFLGMTVYIGHPAFKRMGGRQMYSALNGVVFVLICFFGLIAPILASISLYSINPIIIFIGLLITTDTLLITPKRHIPALLLGLLPVFANIGVADVGSAIAGAYDAQLGYLNNGDGPVNVDGAPINTNTITPYVTSMDYVGMTNMSNGYILISILWAAIMIYMIDRKFVKAAAWSFLSGLLAFFGIIHAPVVLVTQHYTDVTWRFCVGYAMMVVVFLIMHAFQTYGMIDAPDYRSEALEYPTDDIDWTANGYYGVDEKTNLPMFIRTKVMNESDSLNETHSPGEFNKATVVEDQNYELHHKVDIDMSRHHAANFDNTMARQNLP